MNKIAESVSPLSQQANWSRALSIAEHMAARRSSPPLALEAKAYEEASQKLHNWRQRASLLDDTCFTQRLAEDEMSEEDFLALLSGADNDHQAHLYDAPAWLTELAQALNDEPEAETPVSTPQEGKPKGSFLTCITPLVLYAQRQLKAKIDLLAQRWQPLPFDPQAVLNTFSTSLLGHLGTLISRTMTLELHVARLRGVLQGETAEERFQYFVHHMAHKEVLFPVLEEYPVLARLAMTIIDHWVAFGSEFLGHLCADWQQICATFSPQSDPGVLIAAEAGAGDTHRKGHSVIRLTFSSGLKLVYKPKSLAADVHFQELLHWLNQRGDHPRLYCMKLLDRGSYGWSEFIPASSCTSSEEIARFYERQGAYLALLYALDATDFHYENLIAMGEHPVLIDLEALFQPHVAVKDSAQGTHWISDVMGHSVLRVGLLPQLTFMNAELEGIDISGLGGQEGQKFPHPVPTWEDIGTDQTRFVRKMSELPGQDNRPRLDGEDVNLLDYRQSIVTGFTRMYTLLQQHRAELLAGPLARFMHDEIRIILRPTNFYGRMLFEGTHPDLLSNMLDRDCFLDLLWGAVETRPAMAAAIAAERRDLHGGDIPMFTTTPGSYDIFASDGERIPDFISETSFDLVKKRLASFGEQDLSLQSWFIEASLTTTIVSPHEWRPTKNESLQFEAKRVDREQLLHAASLVSERLSTLALSNDEMAHWLGVSLIGEKKWMLMPISANLYDGLGGIMLFLAYMGALTDNVDYTQLARRALYTMRKDVAALKPRLKALGAFDGWGGFIYPLAHLGSLWNEPELLTEAEEIVELLPELIEQDKIFEVMAGAAGCILALASLYQVRPSARTREVALLCGDHLLTHAQPINDGVGWPSALPAVQPLTGFSHGAAGIGYSLLVLAAMTGEERFRQTALSAMQYERSVFVPAQQNWPDLRIMKENTEGNKQKKGTQEREESNPEQIPTPSCMIAWCHGAPGIGLARLGSLAYVDDAAMHTEIEAALRTTLTHGFGMNHSLCHGDLGNLETALMAARVLGDAHYEQEVERVAAAILGSIEARGWLTGVPFGVETPGLMTGLAGIGYELLRLAYPDRVPSVLLLEPPRVPSAERAD